MSRLKKFFLMICLLSLVGCATVSPVKMPPTYSRAKQIKQFQAIKNWHLTGVLSIRTQNAGDSLHWSWQQNNKNYLILLSGPLGLGTIRVTGKPHVVLLERSDGKKFSAPSADQLLAEQTGWPLPIENLFYWIRTLPAPNASYQTKLNTNQQIATLIQDDWVIQYQYANNKIFPTQIILKNTGILIKIIVRT